MATTISKYVIQDAPEVYGELRTSAEGAVTMFVGRLPEIYGRRKLRHEIDKYQKSELRICNPGQLPEKCKQELQVGSWRRAV